MGGEAGRREETLKEGEKGKLDLGFADIGKEKLDLGLDMELEERLREIGGNGGKWFMSRYDDIFIHFISLFFMV